MAKPCQKRWQLGSVGSPVFYICNPWAGCCTCSGSAFKWQDIWKRSYVLYGIAGIAYTYQILSGWWLTYPSEKWWSEKSVGIITVLLFPTEWKNQTCSKPPTAISTWDPTTRFFSVHKQRHKIQWDQRIQSQKNPQTQYSTPRKPWFGTAFQHTWAYLGGV